MKKLFIFMFFIPIAVFAQPPSIVPRPASLKMKTGTFTISSNTYFLTMGSGMENSINFLNKYLQSYYGFQLKKETKPRLLNVILLNYERMDNSIPGAYSLDVNKDNISINADNEQGLFYGIQTLIQLLPPEKKNSLVIPQLSIVDSPRFAYRGMHLDVSRHFFPVSDIKKYIDYIALHKMNYFHWHLTDDHGWRIEIKKYPKLTSVGAWRNGTIIGRYPGTGNDHIRYGGFYTQEQVKDIVDYAAKRYITVIPEIEMPGHSLGALAAYPELGTNPDSIYEVAQTWGIFGKFNNVLNPTEYTFTFLENVLDEVMQLFPSPYIHIGGDECFKRWWHNSAFCQQLMKDKGMKDENELQSYFIQRIEKYLNSKGRKIIGWDEILEGGLAKNATVMSWRGVSGGIAAAKDHHNVIMTPEDPLYLNHSQTKNEDSVTAGGYGPIEKVYTYEPVPKELNKTDAKYVWGAQGNLWTEYVGNQAKLEYMLFPRISALSEILWSPKDKRNWNDFEKRLSVQFKRYDLWKINYSRAYFDLKASISPTPDLNGIKWEIASNDRADMIVNFSEHNNSKQSDTILKSTPFRGDSYFNINKTGEYSVKAFYARRQMVDDLNKISDTPCHILTQKFFLNKATGKIISLSSSAAAKYPGDGAFTLVNGVQNEAGLLKTTEFLGFQGTDCEATIDFGKETEIDNLIIHILDLKPSWIYPPSSVTISSSSNDMKFTTVNYTNSTETRNRIICKFNSRINVRFLKILMKNFGIIPDGNAGAGNPSWLLVDEIEAF